MKRLLLILILTFSFQSFTKADDIRDFEIEEMSIGDSALDYFTLSEIKNKKISSPNKKIKIDRAEFRDNYKDYKDYSDVQLWWFRDDKNYTLVGLSGEIMFDNEIEKCKIKQKEISLELEKSFNLSARKNTTENMHDMTKKSMTYHHIFDLNEGDQILIQCYYMSKQLKDKFPGTRDHLKVILVTKKMNDHYLDAKK
jgi:uncharacterized pyridoxamine 5'-phosphate oxidase family protein